MADNLELNEVINKNLEGDEIDRFREKIKKLLDKIFKEIKENINRQNIKKSKFVKAIIRIFSILLKANISSVKKIKKIIKQSARLVLNLYPEPNSLLEDSSTTVEAAEAIPNQDEERKESPDKETDTSN